MTNRRIAGVVFSLFQFIGPVWRAGGIRQIFSNVAILNPSLDLIRSGMEGSAFNTDARSGSVVTEREVSVV